MLISNAYAQTAAAADPLGGYSQIVMIVLMIGVFYFLMIRPQQKKAKEHKALIDAVAKGDEVLMQSGIVGKVVKVNEDFVAVEIAAGVEVQVQKPSIAAVLPKGTLKNL